MFACFWSHSLSLCPLLSLSLSLPLCCVLWVSCEIGIINSGHGLCIFSHSNSVWNQWVCEGTVITEHVACCASYLKLHLFSKCWLLCIIEWIMYSCMFSYPHVCLLMVPHALPARCWWQELLHRTSLENQKLSLMGEVSYLKLKLADMEGKQSHGAERQHKAEVGLLTEPSITIPRGQKVYCQSLQ